VTLLKDFFRGYTPTQHRSKAPMKPAPIRPWNRFDALRVCLYLRQFPKWTALSLARTKIFGERTEAELQAASRWDVLHSPTNWTGDILPEATIEKMPERLLNRVLSEIQGLFIIPVLAQFWDKSEREIERGIRSLSDITVAEWRKRSEAYRQKLIDETPLPPPTVEERLHAQILNFAYRLSAEEIAARPEFEGRCPAEIQKFFDVPFAFRTLLLNRQRGGRKLRFGEGWQLLQSSGIDLLLSYSRAYPKQVALRFVALFFGIGESTLINLRREQGIQGAGSWGRSGRLQPKLTPIGPYSREEIVSAFHLFMLERKLGFSTADQARCLCITERECKRLKHIPIEDQIQTKNGRLSLSYRDLAILWVKAYGGRVPYRVFQETLGIRKPGLIKILYAGGMDFCKWEQKWTSSTEHRLAAYPEAVLEPEEILHARILIELFGWTPEKLLLCKVFEGKSLTLGALKHDIAIPLPFSKDQERWKVGIFGESEARLNPSGRALYHSYFKRFGGVVPFERLVEFFGFPIRQSPLRAAIGASLNDFLQARKVALENRPPELPGVYWKPAKFTLLHFLRYRHMLDAEGLRKLKPFREDSLEDLNYHLRLPTPFPVKAEARSSDWLKTQAPYAFIKGMLREYRGCGLRRELRDFSGLTFRTLNIFIEGAEVNALEWDALPEQADYWPS